MPFIHPSFTYTVRCHLLVTCRWSPIGHSFISSAYSFARAIFVQFPHISHNHIKISGLLPSGASCCVLLYMWFSVACWSLYSFGELSLDVHWVHASLLGELYGGLYKHFSAITMPLDLIPNVCLFFIIVKLEI